MGNLHIPIKTFFENLGVTVITPPHCTQKTLDMGTKHSPEFICLPLKINIGNFIEALEMGADTILMAGGIGPCRFGYYAEIEKEILKDLGYDFKMIVLDPPQGNLKRVLCELSLIIGKQPIYKIANAFRLAWAKAVLLEDLEKLSCFTRPREINKGDTERISNKFISIIDKTHNLKEISNLRKALKAEFDNVPVSETRKPVKIVLVGEIYTVLEPFVNLNMIKTLGDLGAEVTNTIRITEWANVHILLNLLRFKGEKDVTYAARPYINYFVGGHGIESVGNTVLYSKKGYDGVVHLLPFTCMPEIVAKSVLPQVSADYKIPVMTLVLDEHSAEAGLMTRLEAFIDLLNIKRRKMASGKKEWLSV
jgi:predicted nucleotide-binding protein (sugar kinase/HSP70/actin superfamily)